MTQGLFLHTRKLEIKFFNAVYFQKDSSIFIVWFYEVVIFFLFTLSFRMFHHKELEISLSVFPFASVFVSDDNFSSKRIKLELFLSLWMLNYLLARSASIQVIESQGLGKAACALKCHQKKGSGVFLYRMGLPFSSALLSLKIFLYFILVVSKYFNSVLILWNT